MSLTQKAKKKIFGSLAKRKKLKISDEEGGRAPPLPPSRPPLPTFMKSTGSSKDMSSISYSTSLPDQIDRVGSKDFSLYSSSPSVYFSANTPEDESLQLAAPNSQSLERLAISSEESTSSRNSAHLISYTKSSYFEMCTSDKENMDLDTGAVTVDQASAADQSTALKTENHTASLSGRSKYSARSRSSPSLTEIFPENVDSDQFVNSLFSDIISSYQYCGGSVGDNMDDGRDLNVAGDEDSQEDSDVFVEEVIEPDIGDNSPTVSTLQNKSNILDYTSSKDRNESINKDGHVFSDMKSELYNNENNIESLTHENSNISQAKIPRMDNSVSNKIKFFELCQENASTSSLQNSSVKNTHADIATSDTKAITNPGKNKQNPLHKQTKTISFWKNSTSSSSNMKEGASKMKKLMRPMSYQRVVLNPPLPRLRLNFSRFRSSGSIPEFVDKCRRCGRYCEDVSLLSSSSSVQAKPKSTSDLGEDNDNLINGENKVCYHPLCTEDNGGLPLMLCRQCELDIHKNPEYNGHLVLDSRNKRDHSVNRPPSPTADYDDENESDAELQAGDDKVDGMFIKNNSQIRIKATNSELERKLKRKKALKKKGKNDLEDALAQIADPEGLESSTYYTVDSDSSEQRSLTDADHGLEDVHMPSIQRQDSFEGSADLNMGVDSNGLTNRAAPVRRQSKISLNDCNFTLKFGILENGQEDLDVVAAKRNVTLREAIEAAFIRRGIDLSTVNVFIEKSNTPLPMSSDTSFLVGNILEIKEKDDKETEPQNQSKSRPTGKSANTKGSKQAGGSLRGRSRSGNLSVDDTFYPATSPGGSWSEAKRGKSPKLSVVGLFAPANKDKERQDQLTEILNRYSLHGLPPFPDLLALGRPRFDDGIFEMEPSWKSIVDTHQTMSKKQQEHQEAVWELLLTEVSYIKQIRVIIDVFQNCLINVQQESFLNEIETERLFSNIDKVFECNCRFWQQYLMPILQRGRESKQPLEPSLSKEGFVDHFRSMFEVYFRYFIEHKSCLEYAKICMENSDLFKIFIQWAETQKQCNRLKLADILVKPMQRLLKYSLLLQAILKHTDNERDRMDIQEMIQSVDKLCWAANNSLRRREEYEKLEAVRKTIEPYDAIEAPNDECAKIIQEYNCQFNLLSSMPGVFDCPRSLVFHSSLRMREAQNIKLDVDCLLFTDLILICKSNKRMERYKIIRPPMRLDQLVASELKDKGSFLLIYKNEYSVPISAFTFHSDVGAVRLWLEKFRETQEDYKARVAKECIKLERFYTDVNTVLKEGESNPVISVPSFLDLASSALPRSESTESADHFMPNLLTPSDISSSDLGHLEHTRSSSTGDFQNHSSYSSVHRDMPHASTEPKLGSPSVAEFSPASKHRTIPEGQSTVIKHKPVQTSRSVPNIMVGNGIGTRLSASSPSNYENNPVFQEQADDSVFQPSSTSQQQHDIKLSPSQGSFSEQNSISDEEDIMKLKLNSRRVSRTEKRYHTADAIQDMKISAKDASIHKRLSWRTDVQMDHKNLDSKVQSTDSIRSIPSSSGVSSTGSLHLTMENDISEEQEGKGNDSDNYSCSSPTRVDKLKLFLLGDAEDIDDETNDDCNKKHARSRSASDLVTMFSSSLQVSQMKDGIASVAVTTDGFNRKLTPADILKMKKLKHQILYDANIESSEV